MCIYIYILSGSGKRWERFIFVLGQTTFRKRSERFVDRFLFVLGLRFLFVLGFRFFCVLGLEPTTPPGTTGLHFSIS